MMPRIQFSRCFPLVLLLALLALSFPRPLHAQYVFIDANANGVHDAGDVLNPNGTPTPVDVWIDTNHNRDGSLAVCDTGDGDLGTWNSFAMHFAVSAGTVSFTNYVNNFLPFAIRCSAGGQDFVSNSTLAAVCQAGFPMAGGRVKMFTMTVTGMTGTPSVQFVPFNSLDVNPTSFGTPCQGLDFDDTYKLGSDWHDADGLGAFCISGCPPFLNAVADMTVNEGGTAAQTISAIDPDGGQVTFAKVSGPAYMTVTTTDPSIATGSIALTPGYTDAASGVPASVNCSDGTNVSQTRSFLITVVNVNRAPVANAGGPYSGVPNTPIAFDGTASADPDGDALTYVWNFGDTKSATGPTPAHSYSAAGSYVVVLTVSDGSLSHAAGTIATITDVFAARAFTTKANRVVKLGAGKPYWTIQIEPVGGSFSIGEVGIGTIRMKSTGTGTVSEVSAVLDKTSLQGDADGNGVPDIGATFAKQDLRALFSNLSGSSTVTVTLEGGLTSGGIFRAQTDIGVVASGGNAVAVLPNPMQRTGEVWFTVAKPGRVRVAMFDVSGRLVRVLDDRVVSGTGPHVSSIDGRSRDGSALPSGIYYVRVSTDEGVQTQRITVLK